MKNEKEKDKKNTRSTHGKQKKTEQVDEFLNTKEDEERDDEESWDIKRIFIGLIIIGIIGFLGYTMGLPLLKQKTQTVLSAVSEKNISTPDQKKALDDANAQTEKLLEQAKNGLSDLTGENVSSNAGQLQKIIQDLQAVQQRTKQPIDVICDYVCRK